ncbi:MAG: NAD(P)-dependent oxidoreductase [Succinivibrio sp.]|nr:NAD(P)-dependent oxidoreductase [Succinivibrio sp.]
MSASERMEKTESESAHHGSSQSPAAQSAGSGTNKVLVTGAAGWLGLALCAALKRGLEGVPALSAPDPNLELRCLLRHEDDDSRLQEAAPGCQLYRGNITEAESLQDFFEGANGAALYHCAGIIHPHRVKEFMQVNCEGAVNVFKAAARTGVKRMVVMSSNSPCGCNPYPEHIFDENSPYNPYMGYGRSKMQMELRLKELAAKEGAPELVIIRAPWFYGPYQPPRQTEFFCMVRDGRFPLLGDGTFKRSMSYTDNLAQGMILAGTCPQAAGETFWLADERPYTMTEIIKAVRDALEHHGIKCKQRTLRLPSLTGDIARLVDITLQSCGLYSTKFHVLSEMNKTIACDVSKAKRVLGYAPTVELYEGMRRSVASLLANPVTAQELKA